MSDELKDKFHHLVADPPPPTAVPSEAVFAKVKTVRRRRAAGVTVVAAAAVAAIAVAGTSLTDANSHPPVTSTPGAPTTIVTGPPTIIPTTAAPTTRNTTTGTTTTGSTTGKPPTGSTTGGPTSGSTKGSPGTTGTTTGTTTTGAPALPPIGTSVTITPKIDGRSLTMMVTLKGTVLVPRSAEDGKYLPTDSFMNLSTGTNYTFGDGEASGSDGGSITCVGSKKRHTGQQTYNPTFYPHVYQKPGTYTFTYTQSYCGGKGSVTKSVKIVIR